MPVAAEVSSSVSVCLSVCRLLLVIGIPALYAVCRRAQMRLAAPGREEAARCTHGDDGSWASST